MKTAAIMAALLFISACAAKEPLPSLLPPLVRPADAETAKISKTSPADFEKVMPESPLILDSLVSFEKTYGREYSEIDVRDVAAGDSMASVLKKDSIDFTMPLCPALVIRGDFTSVSNYGYDALVYGPESVEIFSAYECARYASLKRTLRGEALILGERLVEWEGGRATVRSLPDGEVFFSGETGGTIASAGIIGGKLVLVFENGYVSVFDNDKKLFSLTGSFPLSFSELRYAAGTFYGILRTGELFFINDDSNRVTSEKDCVLSRNSPYAFCEGRLTGDGESYDGLPKAPVFSAGSGLYLALDNGSLNVFSLENSWQRKVSFGYSLPEPCVTARGEIFFESFSGEKVRLSGGKETIAENVPETCSVNGVTLEKGDFICGGSICGTFAAEVNFDASSIMLKRTEGKKIYYYFVPRNAKER